uniref:Uncharacterized protein n=1 Tax=Mycena chlorophos TaxID=658473 RepID=A0ABQ0L102_MYCCL|nr:predicted protein [Mycena chlorophos]
MLRMARNGDVSDRSPTSPARDACVLRYLAYGPPSSVQYSTQGTPLHARQTDDLESGGSVPTNAFADRGNRLLRCVRTSWVIDQVTSGTREEKICLHLFVFQKPGLAPSILRRSREYQYSTSLLPNHQFWSVASTRKGHNHSLIK